MTAAQRRTAMRVARAIAVAIAALGLVDPALSARRGARPVVAVVASDAPDDRALAARVERALERDAIVVRDALEGAAGAVIVGDELPADAAAWNGTAFAVTALLDAPMVRIRNVSMPPVASLEARTPVEVAVFVHDARGGARTVDVTLLADGVILDRATRAVAADSSTLRVTLAFVPTATGLHTLRVMAVLRDGAARAAADVAVAVTDARWSVLFFDRRPSWMSTFLRRSIERDPRFVVASRVQTSRATTTDAGTPPASLDHLPSLDAFDVIVSGAPNELTPADVAGLDAYLRRRGGSLVLLYDTVAVGASVGGAALTHAAEWALANSTAPFDVRSVAGDSAIAHASAVAVPDPLPMGATPLALAAGGADSAAPRAAIWQTRVGRGRVIVSGALDAWRFRVSGERTGSVAGDFESFWGTRIAAAARAAAPPLDVTLDRAVLARGDSATVRVVVRDVALARDAATARFTTDVAAVVTRGDSSVPVRLWPDGVAGHFRGVVRAPATDGAYALAVTAGASETTARFVVRDTTRRVVRDDRDLIAAWVESRGGRVVDDGDLPALRSELLARVAPPDVDARWHPMRAAWWLVPFIAALGAEWWWRRRAGMA